MKIRDRATGEIIEVNDNEAANYGISTQGNTSANMGELNISPQQAMMAQLLLPSSQASMVEGAYNIQRQSQQDAEKQAEKAKKQQESDAALKGFTEVASELKQGTKDVSVLNALPMKLSGALGNETDLKNFERKRAVVTQFLAKLGEGNRITDKDREFYTNQILNISPYGGQKGKEEAIDNIIKDVVRLAGEDPDKILGDVQNKKKESSPSSSTTPTDVANYIQNNPVLSFFEQLGSNANRDFEQNVEGVKQLPGQLFGYTVPGMVYNTAKGNTDYLKPQNVAQTAVQTAEGMAKPYTDFAQNPAQTLYENPLTTIAAFLPFAEAARGKGVTPTSTLDDTVKAPKSPMETITSIADDANRPDMKALQETQKVKKAQIDPSIDRIIKKAGKAGEGGGVPQMARNVYQSVLNFSKKNKAFERLKPNETVATMIEDGITGTPDQIMTKMETVTGKNGILSNVVNESIADTKLNANLSDINKVYEIVSDSQKGRYAELRPEDFNAVNNQLNNLPQLEGKAPGTYDLSRLLDYERTLQQEAQNHRINGFAGDVRSKELANFKSEVASEIGDIIDAKVNKAGSIDKYKDPAIINELSRVSPKLAERYKSAKTISEIRSLQRDYVRMNQIMELVMQEPSSLGRNLFRAGAQIPVVGPILDTVAQQAAIPATTKAAIGINNLSQNPILNRFIK